MKEVEPMFVRKTEQPKKKKKKLPTHTYIQGIRAPQKNENKVK